MLTEAQEYLFSVTGQSLVFDVPEGRPSSVTDIQVWQDDQGDETTEETATTGSASVDAVNTTFDADSAAGQTQCNLTATTSIVAGRQYLATNALGEKEWIQVTSISSGAYALSRTPLLHSFANADTFVGTRISIGFADAWVQDKNNLSDPYSLSPRHRAVWTYVVGGVTYRAAAYFDLVRYPTTFGITPADVDLYSPGWLGRLSQDDRADPQQVIKQAVRRVKRDLSRVGRHEWAQRNSEQFNDLIIMAAVMNGLYGAVLHGGQGQTQYTEAFKEYRTYFDEWVVHSKAAEQISEDGSGGQRPRAHLTVR